MRYGSRRLGVVLLVTSCATPSSELPECAISAPDPGVLRVDHTAIRDEAGRAITLRGINAGGRSKWAPFLPFEVVDTHDGDDFDVRLADYLDRIEAWGFDVLRVPFSWDALEPVRGDIDEAWLDRYGAILDAAWARGLWTIVDFHQDVYAEAYCGDGFPTWSVIAHDAPFYDCDDWSVGYGINPDVQEQFRRFWADTDHLRTDFGEMWKLVAARFADHPGVIGYEPINEPGWVGLDPKPWAKDVLTPFYTDIGRLIRRADGDALVFFDATGLDAIDGEPDLDRPEGDFLVFAPHWYAPGVFSGEPDLAGVDVEAGLSRLAEIGGDWDLPVLLGEFGVQASTDGAPAYLRRHYEAIDALGLHATLWEYSRSTERWNGEALSVIDVDGSEAPTLDVAVRPYLRALAGDDAVFTWDASARAATLSWTGVEDGITEVVLPSRTLREVRVEGEGACQARAGDRLLLRTTSTGPAHVTIRPD